MNNQKEGLVIVLSGPSGCGKGTVVSQLVSGADNIFVSVSATTRKPRDGEIDGKHYFFMDKEDFLSEIDSGGMLEYACYCDNYYGTPLKPVQKQCKNGNDVILEIDVQGALQIKSKLPDAVFIFMMPPSLQELKQRLINRNTEDEATIDKRLKAAIVEMKQAEYYDYIVVNDQIQTAIEEVLSIIKAEKCKIKRTKNLINEVSDYA